jgi:hypothetical protein
MSVEAVVSALAVNPKTDMQNSQGQARQDQKRRTSRQHQNHDTPAPDPQSLLNAYGELIGQIIDVAV